MIGPLLTVFVIHCTRIESCYLHRLRDNGAKRAQWLAISGAGLHTPSELRDAFAATPDAPTLDFPTPMKDNVMFGPEGCFSNMLQASHSPGGPARRHEILDINTVWPDTAREILGQVRVPVHYRQAEVDRLWIVDKTEVLQFAEAPMVACYSRLWMVVRNFGWTYHPPRQAVGSLNRQSSPKEKNTKTGCLECQTQRN
jgi:hypothetical protein